MAQVNMDPFGAKLSQNESSGGPGGSGIPPSAQNGHNQNKNVATQKTYDLGQEKTRTRTNLSLQ